MIGWSKVMLDNHVDLLTGFPFKSSQYTDDPEDIRLLRGDNVAQGLLRWNGVKRWPRTDAEEYSRYWLQQNDVILAMDRPWIEAGLKWSWVRESDLPTLLVQRVARLRGMNGLNTPFLRYLIGSPQFAAYVKSITTGANIPHISGPDIKKFTFSLPPLHAQERIVDILSAYDDLIENNTKRIKILEEMTRSLYREWFVHFRFPGHDKVKMGTSLLGKLPEGWLVEPVTTQYDIKYGKNLPKTAMSGDDVYPVYGAGGIIGRYGTKNIDGPTTLVTSRGAGSGTVWRAREQGFVTNNSFTVTPNQSSALRDATSIQLQLEHAAIASVIGGAAQPQLTIDGLSGVLLACPSKSIAQSFDALVRPIGALADRLAAARKVLREMRDLLMPRLMSGGISV